MVKGRFDSLKQNRQSYECLKLQICEYCTFLAINKTLVKLVTQTDKICKKHLASGRGGGKRERETATSHSLNHCHCYFRSSVSAVRRSDGVWAGHCWDASTDTRPHP